MNGLTTTARGGNGWQLILADLALILFLLTLSALPAAEAESGRRLADTEAREKEAQGALMPQVDAAQALYRQVPGGPDLSAWLAEQQADPRATLTIVAVHTRGQETAAWTRAQALAAQARAQGARVRTIISAGVQDEVYASLGYDAVVEAQPETPRRRS
ncbi:hypothetical protein [Erythrobacter sp. BLCC-B19]|uniref:hypothetical protein n=1 Tax=Erythrobacter sp. BLCC-B19 TaxID=3025315 RepID=UPI00235F9185|nr:hypothetical protein [Erythrobacter sp. BLCC-B19]WDA41997.1 hypothetical protein PS060_04075 [Erythrobacter sp. BLCC-B19]